MTKTQKLFLLSLLLSGGMTTAQAQWSLTGNVVADTNFIGTTNLKPLKFRFNNLPAGEVSDFNTGLGTGAIKSLTYGAWNTALGFNALSANQGGHNNTAIGTNALISSVSGANNIAVGKNALYTSNGNSNQIAIGHEALYSTSTSGTDNLAIGYRAQYAGTTAIENTSIGHNSLTANTGGDYSVAIGFDALRANLTGSFNTASGWKALEANTSGAYNTASGNRSMNKNINGHNNSAYGMSSLEYMTKGDFNTAIGKNAMSNSNNAYSTTAVGAYAGDNMSSGQFNSAFGVSAMTIMTGGNYNTSLGTGADVIVNGLTEATSVGSGALVDASYKVRVGSANVTSIGGPAGWTTFSDARYKINVRDNVPGIEFIKKLQPVTYTIDVAAINRHYQEVATQGMSAEKKAEWEKARAKYTGEVNGDAVKMVRTGFLAQDVEKSARELNYDFSGVDRPVTEQGIYGLRYSEFVPPLVRAVQEQEAEIEGLRAENAALQTRLEKLERLIGLQTGVGEAAPDKAAMGLEQNNPNPFTNGTDISYTIGEPGIVSLKLFSPAGAELRTIEQGSRQKGSYTVHLDGSSLAPGTYYYRLSLNGRELAKKAIRL